MDRVERMAEKVAADLAARAPYEPLSGDLQPRDLAEAYRVQCAVQERLTATRGAIAGRKIALSSTAMQEMCGIPHPVAGVFFARDVLPSPATVSAAAFRRLGVEFELAFEIARDIPAAGAPQSPETVRALVAAVRPAFELVDDRGADYGAIDAFTLVAGNAWCSGVVLGEPIGGWEELDIENLPASVNQEGRDPEQTSTGAAAPLTSLAWVLNFMRTQKLAVGAGEHVITGSTVRTRFPAPGDRLGYDIAGLAAVEMAVT